MNTIIVDFPKRSSASSKPSLTESTALFVEHDNVIEVDFLAIVAEKKAQKELHALRCAFDDARATWVLDDAELPELNKLSFTR